MYQVLFALEIRATSPVHSDTNSDASHPIAFPCQPAPEQRKITRVKHQLQ